MSGTCEADETYIGAKARYMHKNRRTGVGDAGIKKTPVQGILQRTEGETLSRVVLKVVPNTRRPELCGNVRQYVEPGSTVNTDALMSYDDLEKDYDRQVIDHLECFTALPDARIEPPVRGSGGTLRDPAEADPLLSVSVLNHDRMTLFAASDHRKRRAVARWNWLWNALGHRFGPALTSVLATEIERARAADR
jgi:hypothetical protein